MEKVYAVGNAGDVRTLPEGMLKPHQREPARPAEFTVIRYVSLERLKRICEGL